MNDGESALHTIDEVIMLDGDNVPARLLRSEADTLLEDYEGGKNTVLYCLFYLREIRSLGGLT